MNINVKLPGNVVNVPVPHVTTTAWVNNASGGPRVTRSGNIRVTRGGNTRITHYLVTSYPELVSVKLENNVINAQIGEL